MKYCSVLIVITFFCMGGEGYAQQLGGSQNYSSNTNKIAHITSSCHTYDTIYPQSCVSYTVPSGDETYSSSGTYPDTIPNQAGCDSILTVELTILDPSYDTFSTVGCESYTVPSGDETYTTNGTYKDTIPNSVGCDSLLTINLTMKTVEDSIARTGDTLIAFPKGATYQWLDCRDDYSSIKNAVYRTFVPANEGDYAVAVTQNNCTDTSDCYYYATGVGQREVSGIKTINFFPNPVQERVYIESKETIPKAQVTLTDMHGRQVLQKTFANLKKWSFDLSDLPQGIYFIKVVSPQGKHEVRKLVKE